MRLLFLLILITFYGHTYAQDELQFGDTGTTTKSPKYKSKKKDFKEKKPIEWVKNSPNGLLLGNPCMEEVKVEMGFIYVIQTKNQTRYGGQKMNEFDRFWHNLAAKMRIMFKNGLFWKFKLKKKRKECRELTGDYVG